MPSDEEAASDDLAPVRTLDEEIFGEREDAEVPQEPVGSSKPDNPWQILAIAYVFFIPGIGFLLEHRPLLFFIGGRRGHRWLGLSPFDVHLLGATLIAIALSLTIYYFKVRRAIVREFIEGKQPLC